MRTFIALELPTDFRSEVAALSRILARTCKGHFLPYENLHVTLAFLGEIDEAEAATVVSVMNQVCNKRLEVSTNMPMATMRVKDVDPNSPEVGKQCDQFRRNLLPVELIPAGLGKFGRSSDATLWMGLKQTPELDVLAARLRDGLASHTIDFDEKPFLAHITLGRRVRLPKGELPDLPFPTPARATNVTLFKSTLSSAGATYKPLYTVELEP